MRDKRNTRLWGARDALVALALTMLMVLGFSGAPAQVWADDKADAQQLVEKARLTLDAFVNDPQMRDPLRSLLANAKGVLIYPQVLRGSFIFGVSGGSGVCLARDEKAKQWGGPAFYTIGEASFGLQAGADASEIVLVALTERGVSALLSPSTKLGVDTAIAAGPVGAGASASTAGLSADVVSYARTKGLYAGMSLQGAVVGTRGALNQAYYGQAASPTDILIRRTVSNPQAAGLIEALTKAGGK